jgi:hypothetical protein
VRSRSVVTGAGILGCAPADTRRQPTPRPQEAIDIVRDVRQATLGLAALLALAALAAPASARTAPPGSVELLAPDGTRTPAGPQVVRVTSTRISARSTRLEGVRALGGRVRARAVVVPVRGFARAAVQGLVVDGRRVEVHPNTLVSLGSSGYAVALQEAVAGGFGGIVGLRIHLSRPWDVLAAGTDIEIGLPVRPGRRRQAPQTSAAVATPALFDLAPIGATTGQRALAVARSYLGTPYVWAGATPRAGFDCSGFTQFVYAQLGIHLAHYAATQWHEGRRLAAGDVRPGDLVFFEPKLDGPGHVGIYAGDGLFVNAPHSGDVVRLSSLADPNWAAQYMGAVRPY